MKKNTHPECHEIEVEMTNGEVFKTRSTWGKKGKKMVLNIDAATHQAWSGDVKSQGRKQGRVARFEQRFKDFKM